MKTAIIINNSAGQGSSGDEPAKIKLAFDAAGVEAKIFEVPGEKIIETIKSAIKSGYETIVAAGGDGTINSTINNIAGTGVCFGVIPLGTLNHFAKDAGLPLVLEEAVEVIAKKNIMKTDIAEVNGHYFINNSSIGMYPKIVKHRDKQMEKLGYGKWYAMFRAMIDIFTRFPILKLKVLAEDHYNEIKTPFLFIGNNNYSYDLFNLGKRQKLDEGILSLYYPESAGRFSMLRFAFLALINRLHQEKDFVNTISKEIQIFSNRHELEVSVDGEVLHLKPPLEYKIHPGKINLLVPVKE